MFIFMCRLRVSRALCATRERASARAREGARSGHRVSTDPSAFVVLSATAGRGGRGGAQGVGVQSSQRGETGVSCGTPTTPTTPHGRTVAAGRRGVGVPRATRVGVVGVVAPPREGLWGSAVRVSGGEPRGPATARSGLRRGCLNPPDSRTPPPGEQVRGCPGRTSETRVSGSDVGPGHPGLRGPPARPGRGAGGPSALRNRPRNGGARGARDPRPSTVPPGRAGRGEGRDLGEAPRPRPLDRPRGFLAVYDRA